MHHGIATSFSDNLLSKFGGVVKTSVVGMDNVNAHEEGYALYLPNCPTFYRIACAQFPYALEAVQRL